MQSGINYFLNLLSLNPGVFNVYYELGSGLEQTVDITNPLTVDASFLAFSQTFTGSGGVVPSVAGALPIYSGQFSNTGDSVGYFTGQNIRIMNETGLFSDDWTMFFVFEKTNNKEGILFSSYHGNPVRSGLVIGINDANKLFLESYSNVGPYILESPLQLGARNAVAITKAGDSVSFNLFDFNAKKVLSSFDTINSNYVPYSTGWYLGSAPDAPDYFYGSPFKGFIDTYLYFSNALMPNQIGKVFSGIFSNGSGVQNLPFVYSFGMDGIAFTEEVNADDYVEIFSFPAIDNKTSVGQSGVFNKTYGEFVLDQAYAQNNVNIYVNGQALRASGVTVGGNLYGYTYTLQGDVYLSGQEAFANGSYTVNDEFIYDYVASGSGLPVHYFINGVKEPFGTNTGVSGVLFTLPIDTGSFSVTSGSSNSWIIPRFARGTSQVWLNGLRQVLGIDYLEISAIDLLTGSGSFGNQPVVFNDDTTSWS